MTDSRIFNRTYEVLSTALDVSARRHNLITGNIANMDTIGYKPRDLDFKKDPGAGPGKRAPQAMETTHENHFPAAGPARDPMNGSVSEDVDSHHLDSVNIDTEMENLVENNLTYRATTELLLRKMTILRLSITEGR